MNEVMTEAELVAAVIATVAALRRGIPKIDGLLVVLVALVVAGLAVFAYAPGAPLEEARHALRVGLSALGAVFLADRVSRNAPDPKGVDGGALPPASPYRDTPTSPAPAASSSTSPAALHRRRRDFTKIEAAVLTALATLLIVVGPSCSSARQDIKAGLDVSDAVCTELEKSQQDEPDWVKFACTAAHIGNGLGQTFLAKVHREDAPQFAARHCPKGDVAP